MRKIFLLVAVVAAGLGFGLQEGRPEARQPETAKVGARFVAVDVFVDSGEAELAAYQVEVKADMPADARAAPQKVTLVGVAGGEHAAFKDPPHYDPAALHEDRIKDRIVLAAFNTGKTLPKGKTRVAQIQVMVEGTEPVYSVTVKAAGAADGSKLSATATAALAGDTR